MNDKQLGIVEGVKLAAAVEAQRIAMGCLNAAIGAGLLPKVDFHVQIKVDIDRQVIALANAGSMQ